MKKQEIILSFLIITYIVYFTLASFLRYDNFYTGRFDLGNMDQTVWNTIHGRIFQLTNPNGTNIISRLAFHADFILILLAPFYLLWSDPRMLLLIQTIILALGAYFVYLISKDVIKDKNLSLIFSASFLLNPAVEYTNLYDFHPVTLTTTFLLGAFYFLIKKRYIWFLVVALLAGLTKEQVWIILALFGLHILFSKNQFIEGVSLRGSRANRGRRSNSTRPEIASLISFARNDKQVFGIIIFLVSTFIFYYLIWHAIPTALGSNHFALSYYSDFGDSPTRIVKNILLSPHKILGTIVGKDQLSYLQQIFLPLGFLSFLSPFYLIFSLPDLFINLLSNNSQLHQIYYQYTAAITPFVFISAIFGVKNLKKWFPKIPQIVYVLYLILAALFSAYLLGPLPFAKNPSIDMFTKPQEDRQIIQNFVSHIPMKFSIAATNNIGSHLSRRQKVFTIPVGIDKADFIAFLLDDHFAQPSLADQKKMIEKIKNHKEYVEVFRKGKFVVFEKRDLAK